MEADILKSLKFEMGNPNVKTFLSMYSGIASEGKKVSWSALPILLRYFKTFITLTNYFAVFTFRLQIRRLDF